MKNKFPAWLKVAIIFVIAAALVFGMPFAINEAYKTGNGYLTLWGAEDVLAFYGTVLGSGVTIAALVITILFTKRQIRRETMLNSEKEKWSKIEASFSNILQQINPTVLIFSTTDGDEYKPIKAIISMQEYQMRCRTAPDILFSYLSTEDSKLVEKLCADIRSTSENFYNLAEKIIGELKKLNSLELKRLSEQTLKCAENVPGYLSEEEIQQHNENIQDAKGFSVDSSTTEIWKYKAEMMRLYEAEYRPLLQLKGATFEKINAEIERNADKHLRLWKNKMVNHHLDMSESGGDR